MRFFVWIDFKYEMLALFVGALLLILVYMAWASYPGKREGRASRQIQEPRGHEHAAVQDYEKIPIAPFIIFIYLGIAAWSVSYLIYIWASGIKL